MSFSSGQDSWDALSIAAAEARRPAGDSFTPDTTWKPLRQHWISGAANAAFQPGWARVAWSHDALVYDVVLSGRTFRNTARRLNELTWELGDVCEIFAEAPEAGHYVEIHITPENQRLQLRFPPDGIAEVRAGNRKLSEFMVNDSAWVRSATHLSEHQLHVRAAIPATVLGIPHFASDSVLRTAVCRYDCAATAPRPLLSSTAPLSAPAFHQRDEWSRLRLSE
ncbi:hypothetical protein [Oleiharenicola lentus]|uniref:hypothetical protein n=1 Tax=Oleiharenicola lentus TaxID=2508720 RepID=UPI003F678053